jgi:hypothetical protein
MKKTTIFPIIGAIFLFNNAYSAAKQEPKTFTFSDEKVAASHISMEKN